MNTSKYDIKGLPKYGTVEFYADRFADIIADIQYTSPEVSDNLIAGFKLAIEEWREYHAKQMVELDRIQAKLTDQTNNEED